MIANESPPPPPRLQKFRRPLEVDEPTMSVATLLLKVEDLIAMTFGSDETNIINFKLLHSILLILATQMRLLEQDVEIRFAEEDNMLAKLKEAYARSPEKEASPDEDKGSVSTTQETGAAGKEAGAAGKEAGAAGKEAGAAGKDAKIGKGGKKGKGGEEDDKGKEKGKTEDEKSGKKGKKKKGGGAKMTDDGTSMTSRTLSVTVGETSQTDRPSGTHIGSIEVVTASKFNLLETLVKDLLKRTGGVPLPTMPSNEDLLAELAKGTATLPDTMGAMQVNARVKAAEEGLTRMAGLLTQLAASGALPPEVADVIAQMQIDLQQLALGEQPETQIGRSVAINAPSMMDKGLSGTASVASAMSKLTGTLSAGGHVTHPEMFEAMQTLETELMKNVEMLSYKANQTAEQANLLVKTVSDKMDIAMKLDTRITKMNEILSEYSEQLSGFDAGLSAQLTGYREQMSQLRNELSVGILQLQSAGGNSESAALMELRAGYESVLGELEQNMTTHSALVTLQKELNDELKGLIENVELLREQKADCDEVADGLRDKANIARLRGLLRQTDFDKAREELEVRLSLSYEQFSKQEHMWMTALKELNELAAEKSSIMELLILKDYTNKVLNEHAETLRKLEYMLGEPKTAMLTRKLARNAQCGPCTAPALMEPFDARKGAPPRLPGLRAPPREEPCTIAPRKPLPEDYNKHVCKRWVGGSHTLLSEHVAREHASPSLGHIVPTKQYTAEASDGRLYHMEEELQPCVECNRVSPDVALSEDGGGDVAVPVSQNEGPDPISIGSL